MYHGDRSMPISSKAQLDREERERASGGDTIGVRPSRSPRAPERARCEIDRIDLVDGQGVPTTAVEHVLRHGFNATSFQTLGPGYAYFFHRDGCVAYVDTGSAWVAAGAPICATEHIAPIARAFVLAAKEAGRRSCFFGTETRFLEATSGLVRSLLVGEQPAWDPRRWPDTVSRHSSLRAQLRRALHKDVRVRVVSPDELETPAMRAATSDLLERWLATRPMPPMGFVVQLTPMQGSARRRCFVAERLGAIVAIAHVVPVPQRNGWFIEHLVRAPHAPNGTTELLVDAVMHWACAKGSSWLTLGLAPLAGEVSPPLQLARRSLKSLYDFEGLRRFKAKLRPAAWDPIYISHPVDQGAAATVLDVLAAFTTDGFVRFGIRALARGPAAVLSALASLLVPWCTLLALASAERWFAAHAAVKWSWVVFDAAVVVGLTLLVRRPSVRLATVLALAVTADALATPLEAAFWNVPRVRTALDALVIAVACAAPAFAAIVLWGARARLARIDAAA